MENRIIIELCAEDRARLDKISDRLEAVAKGLAARCDACAEDALKLFNLGGPVVVNVAPSEPEIGENKAEPQTTPPAAEKPASAPTATPAPTYTHEDLRAEYIRLANAGHGEQARALITEYAPAIKSVPAEKLGEVMQRLKEVG